jgi:hypothetical protein
MYLFTGVIVLVAGMISQQVSQLTLSELLLPTIASLRTPHQKI